MTTGGRLARRCALAVLLAAAGGPAAPADWGIEQQMQALAAVKSSRASFVELKHIAILTTPLQSRGRLVYTAPGRLEKHTLSPRRESLVLEGDQLTVESGDRKQRRTLQLQDQPVVRAFVESIGVGPKEYARSIRLHRALRRAETSSDWARIATDTGYYDQAHLISEFRQLIGLTPVEYVNAMSGDRNGVAACR